MPLFPGPIEQANQQWLRNVSLGSKTTRFAPTQEDTARIREEVEVQKARNFLASGVVQNQLQQQRQQLVDQGILQNRTNNPPTPQVLNQRATPRLTIEEINRLSADDIRTQIEKMGQNQMGDQRSSGMKFLDLIDLPRNSVFNLAFTDEIGVKEVGGVGAGIGMAGLAGAAIGGVIGGIGGLFAGGVTAIPGAIAGAKTGAMVGSGLYTVPLTLASGVGSFLDEEDKESIRKESMEENAGTLGLPRIYFSQVLDRLGMEEGAKRTALGLVGDIVLDPLSWQMRPQANIWTSGARVQGHAVRVSNAGLKNVRHFSEALVKEGAVDATTGLIKVGKNSPFKPLEKLWNQSVIIGDQAHKIHPGMNFGKRATDAKKALDEARKVATSGTKKELKQATRKLENAIQQDILDMSQFTEGMLTKGVKLHDDVLTAGRASMEFLERFQVKSALGVTVPFADWVAPLIRRKTGYRDLGVNVSARTRLGQTGRAYKAMGQTDKAFAAAEALKRTARATAIGKALGNYESTTMVARTNEKGKALFNKINQLKKVMPASLRDKIHFRKTTVDLGSDTPSHLVGAKKEGIRVDVTSLTSEEVKYLYNQGWDFEYGLSKEFGDQKDFLKDVVKVLKSKEDIEELNYAKTVAMHLEESRLISPKLEASRQKLLGLKDEQTRLQEAYDIDLVNPAKSNLDPATAAEVKQLEKDIGNVQDELDNLLGMQNLSDAQLQNAMTPRTSLVLNAVNATRSLEFAGEMVMAAKGPAKLANFFRQHTEETNKIAEQLSRVTAESRRVRGELRRITKGETEKSAELRKTSDELSARLNQLQKEKEDLLDAARMEIGDDVLEIGQQIQKEFDLDDTKISALLPVIERMAQNAPEGREAFLKGKFGKIGADTEGGEILYQPSSKTPPKETASEKRAFAFLSRSGINVGDEAAVTNANAARAQVGKTRAGKLLDSVGNLITDATGGYARISAGARLASDKAARIEGKLNGTIVAKLDNIDSAEDAELVAITLAMAAKENGATIFHSDGVGKQTLVTLTGDVINGSNRQNIATQIKELGLDTNLTTYHIGDIGEIHFLLKGGKQSDEIEKIKQLGYKNVKTEKGTIKTVEAPLIKGERVEETRQAAQRYLYGRAKQLQNQYTLVSKQKQRSKLFSVLGNLTENERLFDRSGATSSMFHSDIEMAIHSLRGLNIMGAGKKATGKDWLNFLQKTRGKKDIRGKIGWAFKRRDGSEMPVPEDILTNAGIRDYLTHAANSHREVDANEILKVIEDQSFDVHLDEYSSSWDSRDPNRVNEIASIAEQRVEVLGKRYDSHVDMISDLVGRYDLFPDTKMGDIRFLDEIDHLLDQISKGKKSLISREALKKREQSEFFAARPYTTDEMTSKIHHMVEDMTPEELAKLKSELVYAKRAETMKLENQQAFNAILDRKWQMNDDFPHHKDYSNITESMGDNHRAIMVRVSPRNQEVAGSMMDFQRTHGHFQSELGMLGHVRISDVWIGGKRYLNIEEVQSDMANKARQIHDNYMHEFASKYGVTVSEGSNLKSSLLKSEKLSEAETAIINSDGYFSTQLVDEVSKSSETFHSLEKMPERLPGVRTGDEIYEKAMIRRIAKMAYEDVDKQYAGITMGNGSKLDAVQMSLNKPLESMEQAGFPLRHAFASQYRELGFGAKDLGIQWRIVRTPGKKESWTIQTLVNGKIKTKRLQDMQGESFADLVSKKDTSKMIQLLRGHLGRSRAMDVIYNSETGLVGAQKKMPWQDAGRYFNKGIGNTYDVKMTNNLLEVGEEGNGLRTRNLNANGAPMTLGEDSINGIEVYHSWIQQPDIYTASGGRPGGGVVDARPGAMSREGIGDEGLNTWNRLQKTYETKITENGIQFDVFGRVPAEYQQKWYSIVSDIYKSSKQMDTPSDMNAVNEMFRQLGFNRQIDDVQKTVAEFTKGASKYIRDRGTKYYQTTEGLQRASVEFAADGTAIIRALNSPDLGSFVHEMGHIVRRTLPIETVKSLANRLGVKDWDNWTEAEEELFAGIFMDYVQKGKAPMPELVDSFDEIADVMKKVYDDNYDKPINAGLRSDLDVAFGATAESIDKANTYRGIKNASNSINKQKNQVDGEISDIDGSILDLQSKFDEVVKQEEAVKEPLKKQLAERKASIRHKAADVLEKADRVIENITGVGRRGTVAGQKVSSLKHELENKTAFYVRLLADEVEKASEKFAKKYNMSQEDAHKLLVAKIIEKDMDALGRTGFHPSDALINPDKEGNIYSIMDKYGGKDRIWHDKTLDNMAGKMQKLNEDYGLKEAAMRGSEVNTSFGYMALRLTDDAEKAAQRQAALQITHSGGQRPVSMQHGAQIARATNRHFYPVANPATADWLDDTGQGWNYIFSKEVAEAMDAGTTNKLPAEYQAYRLAKMRENPSLMEGGDIWAYNEQIRKSGGSPDQMLPGEISPGQSGHTYYQIDAVPTSAYELNSPEMRNRFASLVGSDYSGAIFETDAVLTLAGRTQQHWRMDAVNNFVKNIMPEMKALSKQEVDDYVANPRGGVVASSTAGELVINDITYRKLNETVRDSKTLGWLFGDTAKEMWYPADVARALDDYVKQINSDENLTAIGNIFDFVQGIWKGSVLMHPAWTTVNVMGGIMHSVIVGKVTPGEFAKHFATANKMSHEFHFGNRAGGFLPYGNGFVFDDTKKYIIGGEEFTETDAVKHLVGLNAIDGSQVAREMFMAHRTRFGNPNKNAQKSLTEQIRHIATLGPMGAWWFKLNASIDDAFRTTVYLAARDRGESVDTASLLMKKAHFDYGDFTRYEETIGRRLIPFYAWQRNNIALQAKLLFEKPGYANAYQKFKHALEEEGLNEDSQVPNYMLPRWLKNQLILQVSNDEGKTKGLVIGNLTPIQELVEIGQSVYGEEGFAEMWNYFLSSASPILKTPIEWGMGRQAFNDRAIGDSDLGEKTIVEHMVDQIGYFASFKGMKKAFMRDGMEGILYQLMIRGRFQPLDVDRLQAQISIEKNEEIKKLRRSVNNAVKDGDEERAMRIAERIIDTYRVMYFSGLKERVPTALHGRFTREEVGMKREGVTPPGANIPQQAPFR